jgi:hypothetical protein
LKYTNTISSVRGPGPESWRFLWCCDGPRIIVISSCPFTKKTLQKEKEEKKKGLSHPTQD